MSKREFLMLAEEWVPSKHDVGGWFMSEKMDGQRCFWDGGISRGLLATEVPYANTAKDARFRTPPVATGLWSRYGKVIHAPDWWLDGLPAGVNLDLELWMGRGTFQPLRSVVGSLDKGPGWRSVVGYALDAPGWLAVLMEGELTGTNWKGRLGPWIMDWVGARSLMLCDVLVPFCGLGGPDECFKALRALWEASPGSWRPVDQTKLPQHPDDARERVLEELGRVSGGGGEGLVLRRPTGPWMPKRVSWLLKVKKLRDAEATVTGFTWGRETVLGSRLLGLMGALVVSFQGKRLELSGFTDAEREVESLGPPTGAWDAALGRWVAQEARDLEGRDASAQFWPAAFPRGSVVTFTYRELTLDGVPKEARFLRRRIAE